MKIITIYNAHSLMVSSLFKRVAIAVVIVFAAISAHAQVITPGQIDMDYHRMLNLKQDSITLIPHFLDAALYDVPTDLKFDIWGRYSAQNWSGSPDKATIRILPITLQSTWNSAYAKSMNNGAVWTGRGITQEVHAGFQMRYGRLDVTFQPVFTYVQNRYFDLPTNPIFELEYEKSVYSYPFDERIDYVIRYGDKPFFTAYSGQTDISLRLNPVRIGVSTQNTIVGPSHNNPILLSANGPGLPHLYIQSVKPFSTFIGEMHIKQMWGGMRESAYFDTNPDNNWRYFSGLFIGLQPKYFEGLQVGFNRTFMQNGQDFRFISGDPIVTLYRFKSSWEREEVGDPNDAFDQIVSVTARWSIPQIGLEPYFEYARNDFGGGIFGAQPDHSRAYSLGFTKLFDLPEQSVLAMTAEITNTGANITSNARPPGSYYIHSVVDQGHTHLGQIIGSGMGPGGAFGYNFFLRRYNEKGMHGLVMQYMRINDDFYFLYFDDIERHDFEVSFGYRGIIRLSSLELGLNALVSRRPNMNMVKDNNKTQIQLGVSIRY
jgi:hypothetical protein